MSCVFFKTDEGQTAPHLSHFFIFFLGIGNGKLEIGLLSLPVSNLPSHTALVLLQLLVCVLRTTILHGIMTTVTAVLSFLSPCLKSTAVATGRRHAHTTMATTTMTTMTKTLQRPPLSTASFSTTSAIRNNNQSYTDPPLPTIDTSKRHKGIVMHPDSIGVHIMPGDVVFKKVRHGTARHGTHAT